MTAPPAPNGRVRTVDRRVFVSVLPQLDDEPERQTEVLRGSDPIDLYLIAVGAMSQLVVRHDQRRDAIKALASQADWTPLTLRQTAVRARLSRFVRHGSERLAEVEIRA
jgi:hypothetical protein